jgi:hypothetical protein
MKSKLAMTMTYLAAVWLVCGHPAAAQDKKGSGSTAPAGPAGAEPKAAGLPLESDTYKPTTQDKFLFWIEEDPVRGLEELIAVTALQDMRFPVSRGAIESIMLNVKGKSVGEIKKSVKEQLDAQYYQNATVHLRLYDQSLRPGKVYLVGAIKGVVPLLPNEKKTVRTAILEVGSNDFANLRKVKLFRLNPATNKEEVTEINIDAMMKGGDRSKDMELKNDDRIEVPDRTFVF